MFKLFNMLKTKVEDVQTMNTTVEVMCKERETNSIVDITRDGSLYLMFRCPCCARSVSVPKSLVAKADFIHTPDHAVRLNTGKIVQSRL